MPIPLLNFQSYNPMDTLINSAMGVYGKLNEGKNQESERELRKQQQALISQQMKIGEAELPYISQMKEAELGLKGAQAEEHRQNARKQEQVLQMLQEMLNPKNSGGQNGPMQSGGGASPLMGGQGSTGGIQPQNSGSSPRTSPMQNIGPYPGPSQRTIMIRSMGGVPTVTPDEQARIDLWKSNATESQKKQIEMEYGTSSTISDTQNRVKGIQGTLPIIEDLIKLNVPHQVETPIPFTDSKWSDIFSANDQAAYRGKLANAKESYLAAIGQEPTSGGLHTVEEALGRKPWEDESAYKNRLREEYNTLINNLERFGGDSSKYQRKSTEEASGGKPKGGVKMRAPDGKIRMIPADQVQAAEKDGGMRV